MTITFLISALSSTLSIKDFFMRYIHTLLIFFTLFALPICGLAAGSSSTSPAEGAGDGVSASYQDPSTVTRNSSIFTTPSDLSKSLLQDANYRQGMVSPALQDTTFIRLMKKKSSFQTFVESATHKQLEVFGREFFRNALTTFTPLQTGQVNADYMIGPGDVLQIRGWGMVDIDVNVTVNRNGEIYLPKVGSLKLAGVKYRDLQGYLKKAVSRIFTNFELSVSIAQTRSVQIYVVGHALRPGTYTVSSMSTILNALFVSGGPSITGSMRDIQLKRGVEAPFSFDLYDMLLFGDKSMDKSLQDGDVIFIPEVGPLTAVVGDVKNPAIFELKKKTSLSELVNWAGGFESAAELKNVIIEKSIENRYVKIAELQADKDSISKELSKISVHPSDIIRVFAPSASPIEVKVGLEYVRVDGEVRRSGVFMIEKGENLKSLITRLGGITDKGYLFGTKLSRESVKRDQQLKIDESVDRYEKDIQTNAKQRLAGQSDPAQAAIIASELESQQRLLNKLREVKSEGRIILNLKNSDALVSDLPDIPLEDGDRIYIPQMPTTVDVIGAVYQQNTIIYRPDRNVNDYISLAGGVSATGDKGELYRICADGTVRSKRNSGFNSAVNPGDAVVVPEKIKRGPGFMDTLKDFTTILYQFGLGAAGLKTLKN
jgi:polysaccharide export outer membrane protein